ncbi:MAG: hypothetical protein MZW92_02010, partial [Comamonadaceae bacterium]|nr:hypothetical protein [Comamonadaceae bacterium]
YFVQLRIAKVKQTTTNGIDGTYVTCQGASEDCDNTFDEDGDGAIDCADPDLHGRSGLRWRARGVRQRRRRRWGRPGGLRRHGLRGGSELPAGAGGLRQRGGR